MQDSVNKFNPEAEPTKFVTPQPGDKIICNNGEEFICCTLEFLQENNLAKYWNAGSIFGYQEDEYSTFSQYEWQNWDENGKASYDEWDIREVIPAESKEVVKEDEPRYTLEEIKEAWDASGWVAAMTTWNTFRGNLVKNDAGYQEYLRLKAIYE